MTFNSAVRPYGQGGFHVMYETPKLLQQLSQKRPVFGMTIYSGSSAIVEALGHWGYDFAFLDAEHTPVQVGPEMEKLIMSCKLTGVSPLVRVRGCIEWDIRKALEFGADGVIVPHVRTAEEAASIVRAAKFPPLGRRGADTSVRAAQFGAAGFEYESYLRASNANSMILPMAEDYEFFDNLDAILAVEGLTAINFGPADYSLSRNLPIRYSMDSEEVESRLNLLIQKAHARGIYVMAPVVPPTYENAARLVKKGVDMLIMGNDLYQFNQGCRTVRDEAVNKLRPK
jgi:4-hydroxy-2-oxoheptanedioate aldolase